jgi:hypothetical protein
MTPLRGKLVFSRAYDFQPHSSILILAGLSYQTQQSIVNMRVRGLVSLSPYVIISTDAHPSQREWSRPEHDVTEGIMTSADDMRPGATLPIGLGWYALQRQTRMRIRADASGSTLA